MTPMLHLILLILFSINGNVISVEGSRSNFDDVICEPYKDESCFQLFEIAGLLTYDLAENYCENQSAHLSTIDSQDKQTFIENLLRNHKVVDNVWLGLKYKNGDYVWPDGSEITFTYWADGSPKNSSDDCVQMTTEDVGFGEWSDVACSKKNAVLCEKKKVWSADELQNAVMKLMKNPIPIGFIYVQLPSEKLPSEIWPDVIWTDVTSSYAGLFFRAEGGESSPFGQIQAESSNAIVTSPGLVGDACDSTAFPEIMHGNCTYAQTNVSTDPTGVLASTFSVKRYEIRPRNTAIRIWKRTL